MTNETVRCPGCDSLDKPTRKRIGRSAPCAHPWHDAPSVPQSSKQYRDLAKDFICLAPSTVNQELAIKLFAAWLDDRSAVETTAPRIREEVRMEIGGKVFGVDAEVAPLVKALNDAGIRTIASCSGHGFRPGRISLADGRELFVMPSYEIANWFETQFPRDINGDTAEERIAHDLPMQRLRMIADAAKDGASLTWIRAVAEEGLRGEPLAELPVSAPAESR